MGVVVMGPVAGGQLDAPSNALKVVDSVSSIPDLAMRFVLANPNVDVALSGMSNMQQVVENIESCSDPLPLSDEDYDHINKHLIKLKKMSDLYCTGCGYCMPCPEGIPISKIFDLYNKARVYDILEISKKRYAYIGKNPNIIEKKCPQNISIREQLKEAHKLLNN